MPVSGTRDQRIAQIAALQRGRVATRQLVAAGISSSAVQKRAHSGRLFRVHQGVFAVGHPGAVDLGAETAALLAAGDEAALTGWSAAVVWGMLGPDTTDGVVHVVTPMGRRISHPGIQSHRTRIWRPDDVRIHRGLPVLSPARTLLDLAEQTTLRRAELALDRGLVAHLLTVVDVAEVTARAPTRHGAKILAELVADSGPTTVTRSEAEERVLDLIRQADLPVPRVNARLHGYEVDFYWPTQGFVLEVDGYRYHNTRRAFEYDRRKDATLHAAGILTTRATWRQVANEPYAVIARLAGTLLGSRSDSEKAARG